jgi:hypothetical protein
LKLFFEFLAEEGVGYEQASIEEVARFAGWLSAPGGGPGPSRAAATVNQYMAAIFGCYDYLAAWGSAYPTSWSPGAEQAGAATPPSSITPPTTSR